MNDGSPTNTLNSFSMINLPSCEIDGNEAEKNVQLSGKIRANELAMVD